MALLDLINEELIVLPLESKSKEKVLRELVDHLAVKSYIQNPEIIFQEVLNRENMGSTGLGKGIAIPHARTAEVSSPCLALGISPRGIEFDSLDGKDAHLFFLILAAPDQSSVHIQLLSEIAKLSQDDDICRKMTKAENPSEILDILKQP